MKTEFYTFLDCFATVHKQFAVLKCSEVSAEDVIGLIVCAL